MMTRDEKVMAAAMAAVAAYMQQEEEVVQARAAAALAPPKAPFMPALNLWGQSGRQGMMQLRSLMQMKAFERLR